MPHPATVYGKSKLAGEELVRSLCTRYVIIRSSWMYGIGRDYMNQVIKTYRSGETIKAPRNQIASPTSATAVARAVAYFIDNEKYGTYHVSCNGSATRYEFALEILKSLGVDGFDEKVVPVGEAEGFGGTVAVEVKVEKGKITAIEIVSAQKEDGAYLSMAKDIIPKIIEA